MEARNSVAVVNASQNSPGKNRKQRCSLFGKGFDKEGFGELAASSEFSFTNVHYTRLSKLCDVWLTSAEKGGLFARSARAQAYG